MLSGGAISLLLCVLAGLLLGAVTWGLLRVGWRKAGNDWIEPGDEIMLGLLAVAAFALGAFVIYALLGLRL